MFGLNEFHPFMSLISNFLLLNSAKTEVIVLFIKS